LEIITPRPLSVRPKVQAFAMGSMASSVSREATLRDAPGTLGNPEHAAAPCSEGVFYAIVFALVWPARLATSCAVIGGKKRWGAFRNFRAVRDYVAVQKMSSIAMNARTMLNQ
jgi:hypothetical protein